MANSSYYKNNMNHYLERISSCNKKIEKYKKLIKKLTEIQTKLPVSLEKIKSAETNFLNGGYNDNGETLDRGELKKCATNVETTNEDITSLISQVNSKINELNKLISSYESSYSSAKRNYYAALKEEANSV